MDADKRQIEEDKISLGYLIKRLIFWVKFILSKWLKIAAGTLVILLFVFAYNYVKPKVYTAKMSFVLDNADSGGLGGIGSLASLAGVNIGALGEGSVLFQIDNIQELYRSRNMIETTLLSSIDLAGEKMQLLSRYADANKLVDDWAEEGIALNDFNQDRANFSRAQDSVLSEVVKKINEAFLLVGKVSRKTTILEVGFEHKDEVLAKHFTEAHVHNVNQFYLKTRTKKSTANLQVLQFQVDSVKTVLDQALLTLAEIDEGTPNRNPLYKTSQVPYQKAMIDVQASSAIYEEIVKQLELAKVAHRNQLPLIQIIDQPYYPLPDNKWKTFKTVVIGGFLGVMLMTLYFLFAEIVKRALKEVE